ncbi:hypothetical protein NSIN_30240 [Nitrosotalea sinensis]|uniref:Uncharacterized protein n=1 Tax=Nitrosotalea sinensis TaxID=1499975 RepID=A0A2H1EHW2_9ARCH|nr:hypothetical protein NSIN_30240 [Candidatus Nitrosotalea sinensis]
MIVNIGARLASTTRQRASAPPNIPSLHNKRATGAMIRDIPTTLRENKISGLNTTRRIDTPEKAIHNMSLISRFFRSRKDANPSMVKAAIIRTIFTTERPSNITFHSNGKCTTFSFQKE